MPLGPTVSTGILYERTGFWRRSSENPVCPFDSNEFKKEFDEYIERKRKEDRWYKVTWFDDKVRFQTKIYSIINNYEEAKQKNSNVAYFKNKLTNAIQNGAYEFGGMRARNAPNDGSEMSQILMKWYYRIIKENIKQEQTHQISAKQTARKK